MAGPSLPSSTPHTLTKTGPERVNRFNNKWCYSNGISNATSCCQDEGIGLFPIIEHPTVENASEFLRGYSIAPIASIITDGVAPTTTPMRTMILTTNISGSPVTSTVTTTSDPTALPMREVPDSTVVLTSGLCTGLGIGAPLLAVVGVLSLLLFREKKRHQATVESLSGTDSYSYSLITPLQAILPKQHQFTPKDATNPSISALQHPAEVGAAMSFAGRIEADSREKRPAPPELP